MFQWKEPQLQELQHRIRPLCQAATRAFRQGAYPLVRMASPLMVLGDLHGSFDDLHYFIKHIYDPSDAAPDTAPRDGPPAALRIAAQSVLMWTNGDQQVCASHPLCPQSRVGRSPGRAGAARLTLGRLTTIGGAPPPPPPRGCIRRGGGTPPPLQGAQPMPSPCPPDGKCWPQWHL